MANDLDAFRKEGPESQCEQVVDAIHALLSTTKYSYVPPAKEGFKKYFVINGPSFPEEMEKPLLSIIRHYAVPANFANSATPDGALKLLREGLRCVKTVSPRTLYNFKKNLEDAIKSIPQVGRGNELPGPDDSPRHGLSGNSELSSSGEVRFVKSNRYVQRTQQEEAISSAIDEWLATSRGSSHGRLITLVADGGFGKTRLAWHSFASRRALIEQSAVLEFSASSVDFASAASIDGFLSEFSERLRVKLNKWNPQAMSFGFIPTLLFLDNLETVMCSEVNEFLVYLVNSQPSLCIIGTSRFEFGHGARCLTPIDVSSGMTLGEASALLSERYAESGLVLSESETTLVESVANECHCIPLALELIASSSLRPSEVLAEFETLKSTLRGGLTGRFSNSLELERHVSMKASLDWSLLCLRRRDGPQWDSTYRAYCLCGLFAGPFRSLDVVAIAGSQTIASLRTLCEASLVSFAPRESLWYQHSFSREYSVEHLRDIHDKEELERGFVEHFWSQICSPFETLSAKREWVSEMWQARANWIRAGLYLVGRIRKDERARAIFKEGYRFLKSFTWLKSWDPSGLLLPAQRAFELVGDAHGDAMCSYILGMHAMKLAKPSVARDWMLRAMTRFERTADIEETADCIRCIANIDQYESGPAGTPRYEFFREKAISGFNRALDLVEGKGYQAGLSYCHLANIYKTDGSFDQAITKLENARIAFGNHLNNQADCLSDEADCLRELGHEAKAVERYKEAYALYLESGDEPGQENICRRLCHILQQQKSELAFSEVAEDTDFWCNEWTRLSRLREDGGAYDEHEFC